MKVHLSAIGVRVIHEALDRLTTPRCDRLAKSWAWLRGIRALDDCIDSYSPSDGRPFTAHAGPAIRDAVLDGLQQAIRATSPPGSVTVIDLRREFTIRK